jgi:LmbE family N-acetylglucosaminyl deacetylase
MEQRLLCAFAHPDDECYGPAGTIREIAVRPKGRVRLVIATRGEAGSMGISKQYARHDLARIRQGEMQASAAVLGAELRFLGWPDKGLSAFNPDRAVVELAREIRLFRPQVLLTFHPNGISGHPDHKAMSAFLVDAALAAGDPARGVDGLPPWTAARLFYYAVSATRGRMMEAFRSVATIPDAEATIVMDVRSHASIQHAACRCHVTQMDFYRALQQAEGGLDRLWSTEHLVVEPRIGGRLPDGLKDPFEGIG